MILALEKTGHSRALLHRENMALPYGISGVTNPIENYSCSMIFSHGPIQAITTDSMYYDDVFVCYRLFGVPALAGTCLWRPLTLACVLFTMVSCVWECCLRSVFNLEAHVTSFKMHKLSFQIFGTN